MTRVLVIAERSAAGLDDSTFELITAARSLGDVTVSAAVLGADTGALAAELARWCDGVFAYEDALFETPDGDLAAAVLAPLLEREQPALTLVAHTNTGMDLAPALAERAGVPLLPDCLSIAIEGDHLGAVRTLYGGKVHARVTSSASLAAGEGSLATLRPGACRAPEAAPETGGSVSSEGVPEGCAPRRRLVETVAPEPGAVDISAAEILIAVGRGIEEEENLDLARSLADALGGELACTRPVVDKQWLPKSHQVGTSGTTVKPKVYLALGISGSFQHMGGIKGDPFIVAINKDPAAPIFAQADVGIVGDLFDIVPLVEEKVLERKG